MFLNKHYRKVFFCPAQKSLYGYFLCVFLCLFVFVVLFQTLKGSVKFMAKGVANLTVEGAKSEAFAERLKELTKERGAVPALSNEIGASVSAIRKWINGETEPSRDFLVALADALNVNLLWLATGEGPKGFVPLTDHRAPDDKAVTKKVVYNVAYYLAEKSETIDVDPVKFAEAFLALYDYTVEIQYVDQNERDQRSLENVIDFVSMQLRKTAG